MRSVPSLGRQTIAACAGIGIVVVALFVGLLTATRSVDAAARGTERARAVLAVSGQAEAGLARLEANLGGYEDTGAGALAAAWGRERDRLLERMWRLRTLARDPDVRRDVDVAFLRLGAYLTLHRPQPASARLVVDGAGRARESLARRAALDATLRRFEDIQALEQAHVRIRQAGENAAARRALWTGVALTVVALLLVGALAAYLLDAVVAPIRRLRGVANRLRDGELAARAETDGHPEVGAVAAALNAMAHRLERERAELRRSELEHRALVEHLPDALVVLYDRDLVCVRAEGPMLRKQGHPAGLMEGKHLSELLEPAAYATMAPHWEAALTGVDARVDYASPSGYEYDMEVVPYVADGEIGGVYVVARDVTAGRRAERARRAAEERFREAFAHAPSGMAVTDLDGQYVEVNEALCRIAGRSREALLGMGFRDLIHPEDLAASIDARDALATGALDHWRTEKRYVRPNGDAVTVSQHVTVVRDDAGKPMRFLSQVVDVTEQRRAEAAAAAADRRFAQAFAHAPIGIGLVSLDGRYLEVNEALCAITGYAAEALEATGPNAITHPDDVQDARAGMAALLVGDAPSVTREQRLLHAQGHPVDVSLHVSLVRGGDGEPDHFVAQVLDVTDRKRFEAQLRHMADHDPLTGLLNRRSFEPELARHCAHVARYGPEGALIVLDIDHFKSVNDTLGHSAGDELIVAVGDILRARLRETDVLARLGGDEFAILLPRVDGAQAQRVAHALVEGVRADARVPGDSARCRQITISVGVAMFDRGDRSAEEILVDADLAMYDAKEAGRDGYVVVAARHGAETAARSVAGPQVRATVGVIRL